MKWGWKDVCSSAIFRLIFIVLMVVIPLNLLTLCLSNIVITEVQRQVSMETQNALRLYMNQIDDTLYRINTKLYLFAHNDVEFSRLNEKEITDQEEYYRQLQSIILLGNSMKDILDDYTLVNGVYAYFPEKGYYIEQYETQQQASRLRSYMQEELIAKAKKGNRTWHFVTTDGMSFLLLVATWEHAYYGAWIDLQALANTVGLFEKNDSVFRALTDGQGHIYQASEEIGETQIDIDSGSQIYNGENCVMVKAGSSHSDLFYVQFLSKNQLTDALPLAIRVLQILSIVAVAIIPVIIITMQRWIIRPVKLLVGAMERVEKGDVNYRIPKSQVGSEFDRINGNFNRMMDELSELKISMYEERLKVDKIRLRFLSQQVQPHFILNALNILYSYEPEEYALSQKMILCLSKYFRYIVNANTDLVELGQELDHIQNYFEIQQSRFLRAFRASVKYDQSVADCLIPPLIIQNFSENAIKHALVPGQTVQIVVLAREESGHVYVSICDTGAGISDDILEKIQEFRKTGQFRKDLGVGIQNAIDRLNIIYGDSAKLDIIQNSPHGTCIHIELPIRRKGDL